MTGTTKAEVQDGVRQLHADLAAGIGKTKAAHYTARKAAEDWLENGLPGRSAKTIRKNRDVRAAPRAGRVPQRQTLDQQLPGLV